jgi:hypothetical protein
VEYWIVVVAKTLARIGVVVGLVSAGLVGVSTPAVAAAPKWSVIGTATGDRYGHVAAVSCPSSTVCFAVGTLDLAHAVSRLAERWDGSKWATLTTPNPSGAISSQLTGVACTSATSCIAVGQYNTLATVTKTLVMRWDGAHWSILSSPNAPVSPVSVLAGVACATNTSCFAVGGYFVNTGTTSTELTLVEQWDGTTWTIVPSPNQPLAVDSALTAVSCPSTTMCFAVGSYDTQLVTSTLTERWDGSAWSIVQSENPPGAPDAQLSGVTCPTTSSCFAVGVGHGTLIERWNGTIWGIVTSANPTGATGASLTGVSCPSATRCDAVGTIFRQTILQRLVETWNGTSWSLVTVPVPSGTKLSTLSGVSCATTTRCFAGGDWRHGPTRRPLFERYS